MAEGQKAGAEHYEEIGDYDYNNPNDTSNFCPGLQVRVSSVISAKRELSFPLPLPFQMVGLEGYELLALLGAGSASVLGASSAPTPTGLHPELLDASVNEPVHRWSHSPGPRTPDSAILGFPGNGNPSCPGWVKTTQT